MLHPGRWRQGSHLQVDFGAHNDLPHGNERRGLTLQMHTPKVLNRNLETEGT